jgi:NTP pyrophosphatase (non-canonical NTP hydrolase)
MFLDLNQIRDMAHETAKEKGWHTKGPDPERVPNLLCLVHAEVSEALELYRRHVPLDSPEVAEELADIVIRVADFCGLFRIDLAKAVEEKLAYNRTRSYRHGGKLA